MILAYLLPHAMYAQLDIKEICVQVALSDIIKFQQTASSVGLRMELIVVSAVLLEAALLAI